MHLGRIAGGTALVLAVAAVSAGCTDRSSDTPAPTASSLPPDSLPAHLRSASAKGLGYSVADATDLGRTVDMKRPDLWRYCFSRQDDAAGAVDFWAVPYAEKCPARRNAHVAVPATPSVTGQDFDRAYDTLLKKGYSGGGIEVYYGTDGAVSEEDLSRVDGEVCRQSPAPGRPFDADQDVKLYVAVGTCPQA